MINKYVPLPQPKVFDSPKVKALKKKEREIKKNLGIKGKLTPGDLIKGSMTKRKLAVLGMI